MQAAEENGVDYVYSESEDEEEDSQQIESEYEDSYYDHDDENPGSQEGGYFDAHSPDHNDLIEEEEEEDQEELLSQKESNKVRSGLVMDEDREMLSNLQGEMGDGNIGSTQNLSLGLKPPQTRNRRSLSPFVEKKDPVPGERNRSLSTLTPPKIFMHSVEGEIHDITPKVSNRGDKSFAYHANPDSKNLNDN